MIENQTSLDFRLGSLIITHCTPEVYILNSCPGKFACCHIFISHGMVFALSVQLHLLLPS